MMVSAASLERERMERAVGGRDAELVAKMRDAVDMRKMASEGGSDGEVRDETIASAMKRLEDAIAQLQDEAHELSKSLEPVSVKSLDVAKNDVCDTVKAPNPHEVADIPHDIAAKANWIHGLRAFLNDMNNRLRIQ
jgi:hypothetical protein